MQTTRLTVKPITDDMTLKLESEGHVVLTDIGQPARLLWPTTSERIDRLRELIYDGDLNEASQLVDMWRDEVARDYFESHLPEEPEYNCYVPGLGWTVV